MDPRTLLIEVKRTWQPPAELLRSRPRDVRLTGAGRALLVFAILLLAGAPPVGVLFFVKATLDHEQRHELMAQGKGMQARVTRRWVKRGEHPQYMVEYVYETADQTHQDRISVGRSSWSGLEEGSILPVIYLPSNPQIHLVPGHEGGLMPLWLPYLIFFGMAAGGWLMTRPIAAQRLLLCEGRPAPGVVTDNRKTQHHTSEAHYTFVTLSGALAKGKSDQQKKPPPVGSILCVLYEPDRARHNHVYPLQLVRVEPKPGGPMKNRI
jgi:hypothetical protein